MSLPNTGMSFTPFDPLPASDLNDIVENVEYLNTLVDSTGGHTTIGTNDVRATRYVPLATPVSVVNIDPSATTWTAVDITASTSANAFAARINVGLRSTTATRSAYVRPTGSSASQDDTTIAQVALVTSGSRNWNEVTVGLDTSQSFDWSVSDADVTALTIVVRGYYEYVD